MPLELKNPDIAFAIESVRLAAQLTEEVRLSLPAAISKLDKSPVTIADFSSQALVASLLARQFPGDTFVAEEDSSFLRNSAGARHLADVCRFLTRFVPETTPEKVLSWIDRGKGTPANGRFWTMDPIDGTKGFLRGEQYAVALALIVNGQTEIGVLGCPNLKEARETDIGGQGTLACAVRGQGAWQSSLKGGKTWERLSVSKRKNVADAILLRSVESGHTDTGRTGQLIKNFGITRPPLLMDSLAKYAVVASGAADLLFRFPSPDNPDRYEWIWDQAPGTILVEEAGGMVSDLHGKPLDFSRGRYLTANYGVLLSNGYLHQTALEAVSKLSHDKN